MIWRLNRYCRSQEKNWFSVISCLITTVLLSSIAQGESIQDIQKIMLRQHEALKNVQGNVKLTSSGGGSANRVNFTIADSCLRYELYKGETMVPDSVMVSDGIISKGYQGHYGYTNRPSTSDDANAFFRINPINILFNVNGTPLFQYSSSESLNQSSVAVGYTEIYQLSFNETNAPKDNNHVALQLIPRMESDRFPAIQIWLDENRDYSISRINIKASDGRIEELYKVHNWEKINGFWLPKEVKRNAGGTWQLMEYDYASVNAQVSPQEWKLTFPDSVVSSIDWRTGLDNLRIMTDVQKELFSDENINNCIHISLKDSSSGIVSSSKLSKNNALSQSKPKNTTISSTNTPLQKSSNSLPNHPSYIKYLFVPVIGIIMILIAVYTHKYIWRKYG